LPDFGRATVQSFWMAVNSPQKRSPPKLRLVSSRTAAAGERGTASHVDDDELLAALCRGETGAAAVFHDRVRPEVDRTLYRLLGRRDADHEDMAQLAMIELIYTIDRYRGECSLDGWTSTLTAHVVYKHLRRRQTERRLFAGIAAPEELAVTSPDRPARDAMARSAIGRVLGYDLRETAVITGVSVAAAQTRLVRGRRELHRRIEEDPELANVLEEMEGAR
jgi:RNA polymerase sigma-70 factor (ECF subfamily)